MLKKELDVEGIYRAVEAIPTDVRFLAGLTNLAWTQGDEYLLPIEEKTCLEKNPSSVPQGTPVYYTRYDNTMFEYQMWMTALISLSWLLTNVKNKTEHGQCHNPIHSEMQKQTGYTKCVIGSECHSKLYDSVIDSLELLVKYATTNRPTVIDKQTGGTNKEVA